MNTIMIPLGKKKKWKRRKRSDSILELEMRNVMETSLNSLYPDHFCREQSGSSPALNRSVSLVFIREMKTKLCSN